MGTMRVLGVLLIVAAAIGVSDGRLLMTQVLTRHGERAPDKVVTTQSCKKIWPKVKKIKEDFLALPGRLTPLGVETMRQVGEFIRERYVEGLHWKHGQGQVEGEQQHFASANYQRSPDDWEFIAREGYRQQRSMSAISLGLFPNEPVPVKVIPRLLDSSLGGPAPACGSITAKMIVDWHATTGKQVVKDFWKDIEPFEEICDVQGLIENPVNAKPGGPNPHAWIGDISDSLDSAFACDVELPKEITPKLHKGLTEVAFLLEQRSHYDDPKGAVYFVGEFAEDVLSTFEKWTSLPEGKSAPKKTPKMRLFSCSRELMYGLQHMFGWEVQVPGQPKGRVVSGSTFIWELHEEDGQYIVRSYAWEPSRSRLDKLQDDMPLEAFRALYNNYTATNGGDWAKLCDFEHFNPAHNHHENDHHFENPQAVPMETDPPSNHEPAVNMRGVNDAVAQDSPDSSSRLFSFPTMLVGTVVCGAALYGVTRKRRSGAYQSIN